MEMIGNGLAGIVARKLENHKMQLKFYLEIVEAETDEFTIGSLKNLVEQYTRISDNFSLLTSEEIDMSILRQDD
jgi:hypothetical protein